MPFSVSEPNIVHKRRMDTMDKRLKELELRGGRGMQPVDGDGAQICLKRAINYNFSTREGEKDWRNIYEEIEYEIVATKPYQKFFITTQNDSEGHSKELKIKDTFRMVEGKDDIIHTVTGRGMRKIRAINGPARNNRLAFYAQYPEDPYINKTPLEGNKTIISDDIDSADHIVAGIIGEGGDGIVLDIIPRKSVLDI